MMKIAQISDKNLGKYSETFISFINENIAGDVFYIYGRGIPIYSQKDGYLFGLNKWFVFFIKVLAKLKILKRDFKFYLLKKYLKSKAIQVIIAEYGNVAELVAPICNDLKLPLIVHFHGYDIFRKDMLQQFNNYKQIINIAQAFIAKSKLMQKKIISLGAKPEKVHYIPSGAQKDFFNIEPNYESNVIISVGRFVDKKAPYVVLNIFKEILNICPDLKLIFIGEGPLLQTTKKLAKIWRIENNIEFTGAVSHKEVLSNLSKAFCFIQHSIVTEEGDQEGTPNSLLEASAAGLPVIATKHSGNLEAVIHNETGFLVDELNIDKAVIYLKDLLNDREKARVLGEKGRTYIKNNFSSKIYLKRINDVIKKCVDF